MKLHRRIPILDYHVQAQRTNTLIKSYNPEADQWNLKQLKS